MKGVDLFDQLKWYYRPDPRGSRKMKWWHAFYYWGLNVACTQSYICHKIMKERRRETPMSHADFLLRVAEQLVAVAPKRKRAQSMSVIDENNAPNSKEARRSSAPAAGALPRHFTGVPPGGWPQIVKHRLRQGCPHSLPAQRLCKEVQHPVDRAGPEDRCQYCNFLGRGKRFMAQLICQQCRVSLCIECWDEFHGTYL